MVPPVLFSNFVIERQDDGNGSAYKRFPSGSFLHYERRKEEEREAEYLSFYLVTVGGNLIFPCPLR